MSEFELLVSSFNYYYLTSKQAFIQYAVIAISFGIYFLTKNKFLLKKLDLLMKNRNFDAKNLCFNGKGFLHEKLILLWQNIDVL